MALDLEYHDGQTPIDEDEKEGLLIPTIATRYELDEFEQLNIEEAMLWLFNRRLKADVVFHPKFVLDLHRRMFGQVWGWAGRFRKSNKNMGLDWPQVPMALQALCDDARLWHEQKVYAPDELAIRFKHRIVSIHCFPNGNGRHSRLMADAIINRLFAQPLFQWGGGQLIPAGTARFAYIKALKCADAGDLAPLMRFARS